MTDTLDSETNGAGGEPLDPRIREQLRKSDEDRKRAEDSDARALAAERRAAFAEVGIPTSGVGQLFRDTYQGDPDPAAVKAAAEGYGILGGSQDNAHQDQGLTDAEREAQRRIIGAGGGGTPAGQDPREAAMIRINEAKDANEVMAIVRQFEDEHPELGRFTNPN